MKRIKTKNRMKPIIWAGALLLAAPLHAQPSVDAVLDAVERNNTTLKALRQEAEAQKLGNRTGLLPEDPEVEFGYLWGKPHSIGPRKDLSVTQSFDIPTISGMKGRLADEKNKLPELQYRSDRMELLLQAKLCCMDLIYYNALKRELTTRLEHARTLADAYAAKLERGDIGVLEYNKVRLNLSAAEGALSRAEVERAALVQELRRMNGGEELPFSEEEYGTAALPSDFDTWYAGAEAANPALEYLRQQVVVAQKEISMSKVQGLPSFSAGYTREKVVGEAYRGVAVGVSVPLWENRNRVKEARASARAAEALQTDARQQYYDRLRGLYDRAAGLERTAREYRRSLAELDGTDLLNKALDAGRISVLDYVVELGLYYDAVDRALEAERDFRKAFAELSAVEL